MKKSLQVVHLTLWIETFLNCHDVCWWSWKWWKIILFDSSSKMTNSILWLGDVWKAWMKYGCKPVGRLQYPWHFWFRIIVMLDFVLVIHFVSLFCAFKYHKCLFFFCFKQKEQDFNILLYYNRIQRNGILRKYCMFKISRYYKDGHFKISKY